MNDGPESDRQAGDAAARPQDPLVERLRPDPAQAAHRVRTMDGLLGDSDRPGYRRLYLTRELDTYCEFRTDDVLSYEDIPPERPPFVGESATRVTVRREAQIDLTRSRSGRAIDEFDLDLRLGRISPAELPVGTPECLPCGTPGEVTCEFTQRPTDVSCPGGTACGTCDSDFGCFCPPPPDR